MIHHRRRPLSSHLSPFSGSAGLAGWLAGLLGFWLSGPWTRVSSFSLLLYHPLFLRLLLLGPMYSFYSYTGAVPTCSSGSAGRSFSLFAYRYSRISSSQILESAAGRDIRAHSFEISSQRADGCWPIYTESSPSLRRFNPCLVFQFDHPGYLVCSCARLWSCL